MVENKYQTWVWIEMQEYLAILVDADSEVIHPAMFITGINITLCFYDLWLS